MRAGSRHDAVVHSATFPRILFVSDELDIAAGVPIGRLGTIEDVANAIVFLASPQASFITGQVIVVDGGRIGRAG